MIIARDVVFFDSSLEAPRFHAATYDEIPSEQGVSSATPLRKCDLVVEHDYTERLSILGFSAFGVVFPHSEWLWGGSTIPVKEISRPLNALRD